MSGGDETMAPAPFTHRTVMLAETLDSLEPRTGRFYADVTLGGGGHAEGILEASGPDGRLIGVDRDEAALEAARARLARFGERVSFVHGPFAELGDLLERAGVRRVHGLIADLGVSSPQLDRAERGFSFRAEGPLDMRMDPSEGETALDLIDRLSERELADVLYQLGEERRSRPIARSIKYALAAGELATTNDLRRAVVRAVGPRRSGGIDPATRTFQALRIAVNDELGQLDALLDALPDVLEDGGVAVIISFHSLEDRRVKRRFRGSPLLEPLTKRPRVAGDEEQRENPRARSAKLRAARRVNAGGGDMRARFLVLWSVAVIAAAAAFVSHLALRHHTVALGYEVGRARRAQRRLIEQRRLLAVEAATLRGAERIETIARGRLGMDVPEPERVVPVGREQSTRRVAGRVR